MNKLLICLTFLFFLVSCRETQGNDIDMSKANLFSAVAGVLAQDGVQLSGVKVVRTVKWRDEEHAEESVTDAEGRFRFPAKLSSASLSILPREFNAFQKLVALVDGEEVLLWETVKADPVDKGELEGADLNFTCDVADPLRFEHLLLNSIETRCRW
jgi:hypothetical protein